jgi:hypothetical protein
MVKFKNIIIMKKLIIGALISVMTLSTYAQTTERIERTPEERASARTEKLKVYLELSEEQSSELKTVFLEKITKTEEIRSKHPGDKEAIRNEMRPVQKDFRASMQEILTDEQYEKWVGTKKAHLQKGYAHKRACNKPGAQPQKAPQERKQVLDIE